MRLLLTNDDGIDAPGLAALAGIARRLGETITVAPVSPCSSCGHQVTTTRPIRLHQHDEDRLSVEGWPADCVRVGLVGLSLDVDWVLAGINAGGNLGADVYVSGTVAAVREAALLGKPGIAVSQYKRRDRDFDWDRAARWTLPVLGELLARPIPPGAFWNVNLPHLAPSDPDPEVVFCPLDPHPLPVLFRREEDRFVYSGDYHGRPRDPGGDVAVCFAGKVAVSLLRVPSPSAANPGEDHP
jgi:5'-nucleotidase